MKQDKKIIKELEKANKVKNPELKKLKQQLCEEGFKKIEIMQLIKFKAKINSINYSISKINFSLKV